MNIYQAIWDADMNENGIRPTFTKKNMDKSQGYVVVDTNICFREHHIIKDVHIPDRKRNSYHLIEKLFDNYNVNQRDTEKDSTYKSKEVEAFLKMAVKSSPCQIAKKFTEESSNKKFSELQWYTYLYDLWFRQFNYNNGKDLSGFEHVFIGEQKGRDLVGHHFWYKYWLEENKYLNKHKRDKIKMTCQSDNKTKFSTPDVVTVGYHLEAFDYEKKRYINIKKRKGTFFVGLSAEGLLAIGTVRANAPFDFKVNGVDYELKLFMSPDGKSIRTFYPTSRKT
ncbi:hypothetical protein [Aquibacillus saliphilus]|uniref:hypothetical protein n=1 Tax=Aquibacillus saliphilus TaxID=1909422 RepID=UPI001CF08C0C|nr:hypothetical protein [Aquibacillus saliphilus]